MHQRTTTATATGTAVTKATSMPLNAHGLPVRVPTDPPPFTLKQLRDAIPKHCWTRPLYKSFGYLAYDLVLIGIFGYLASFIDTLPVDAVVGAFVGALVRHALWLVYWFVQGSVMTGVWVIGHECGHGGFADSQLINDVVGWIFHSALLVPYFSWQISHRKHHSNTGNLDHDEVFVPAIPANPRIADDDVTAAAKDVAQARESLAEDLTIVMLAKRLHVWANVVVMLLFGWPLYLLRNATGNKSYPMSYKLNHFHPDSPIGADIRSGSFLIFLSDVGLLIAFAAIGVAVRTFGAANVFYFYGVPYLITNASLVLITFLQHTDTALPHYRHANWDWLRGALATVDRDYGILNLMWHHITDTHVAHHLFSSMPHYHAQEATESLKPLLGDYYRFDDTPILQATYRAYLCEELKLDAKKPGVFWF